MLNCIVIGFSLTFSMPEEVQEYSIVRGNNFYKINYLGNNSNETYAIGRDLKTGKEVMGRVECVKSIDK